MYYNTLASIVYVFVYVLPSKVSIIRSYHTMSCEFRVLIKFDHIHCFILVLGL